MIYLKEGNLPLNLAYDDQIVQEANSTYQLSFKYPLTDDKWTALQEEALLTADDLHGEQEFIIIEVKRAGTYVQVFANQVATLLNFYSIDSISVDRVTGATVMSALAGSIRRASPFSFYSDIDGRHTFNVADISAMDALAKEKHSIMGQWGGDLVRDKYQVKLLKNGGSENESLFMYKKNLRSFEEGINIKNLRTRLHLKKTVKSKEEGGQDTVLAVTVDSPLIGKYRQIYEVNLEVNDQDVVDEAGLRDYGKKYFERTLCDVAENSIQIDVVGDPDVPVKMFDVVGVFFERYQVDLRLKISSYVFSPMSRRLKSIGFGKVSKSLGASMASLVASSIDQASSAFSKSFEEKLHKELENSDRIVDAKLLEVKTEALDAVELANAKSEAFKLGLSQEIQAAREELTGVAGLVEELDQEIAASEAKAQVALAKASDLETLTSQVQGQLEHAKNDLVSLLTDNKTLKDWKASTDPKLTKVVADAKTALDGLTGLDSRLDIVEPVLDELGRQMGARLTQADLAGYVKTTELTSTSEGLSALISRVEGLVPTQIGGRNYIIGSDRCTKWTDTSLTISPDFFKAAKGKKVTISVEVEGVGITPRPTGFNRYGTEVGLYYSDGTFVYLGAWNSELGDVPKKRISKTYILKDIDFTIRYVGLYVQIDGDVNVCRPKLEISSVPSDWDEAWEDRPTKAVVNQIKSTADQNSLKISDTQGNLSNLTQTVNGINTDLVSIKDYVAKDGQRSNVFNHYVETKTAEALTTIRTEVSQGYVGKATLESTVSGINQTFSEIRGQIPTENGGTNLIIGSMTRTPIPNQGATLTFTPGQAVSEWRATDAIRVRGTKGTNNIFASLPAGRPNNTSILDRKYTYSIFIKNLRSPIQVTNNRGQVVDVGTNEAKRVVMTGVGNNASNLQINFQQPGTGQLDFYYWHPQIEVGTLVNDWSLAPEDNDLNVTTKIAEYKNTVDGQFTNLANLYAGKTEFQNVKTTTDLYERILGKTEGDLQTNTSRIVMNSDLYLTEVKRMESNAELLSRVSDGESVTSDPEFANGLNGMQVYDNSGSGKITIAREQNADGTIGQPTNRTSSRLRITHTGAGTPNLGGVKLNPSSTVYGPNISFGVEISALLPVGYSLNLHSNGLGTGGAMKWLTSNAGTGKWERYVGLYQLGTGSINPYALTYISVSGPTPTTTSPLVWYIQRFDIKKLTASKIESMSTQVSQMASSYAIRLLWNSEKLLSELNLNPGGVKIKGDLIRLDGTVSMDDAFIKKAIVDTASVSTLSAFSAKIADLVAGNISAGKITSAMIASNAITAGHLVVDQALANKLAVNDLVANSLFSKSIFASKVQATSINVSQITGDKANFVLSVFNGINSVLKIDSSSVSITNLYGRAYARFEEDGLSFRDYNGDVGRMGMINEVGTDNNTMEYMFIGARPNKKVALSWYNTTTGIYNTALSVGGVGSRGRIDLQTPFYPDNTATNGLYFDRWGPLGVVLKMQIGSSLSPFGLAWDKDDGLCFVGKNGKYTTLETILAQLGIG